MEISGYTLNGSDHASNNKRGGVCIYYFLPLRVFSVQYLHESICFELKIRDKTCNVLFFYRSPSQTQDDFQIFTENLELNLENLMLTNPFLVVAIGDFNAKSSNWFCRDKTSFEGNAIENLTSQFELHRVIKESTHILDTSPLCIGLIFTSQPNLIIESGVQLSQHSSCHHKIIFTKSNL